MALARRSELFFVILFALSTHCIYDFNPFTYPQWTSTWMLRICHIALTAVLSKTEHRILYGTSGLAGLGGKEEPGKYMGTDRHTHMQTDASIP